MTGKKRIALYVILVISTGLLGVFYKDFSIGVISSLISITLSFVIEIYLTLNRTPIMKFIISERELTDTYDKIKKEGDSIIYAIWSNKSQLGDFPEFVEFENKILKKKGGNFRYIKLIAQSVVGRKTIEETNNILLEHIKNNKYCFYPIGKKYYEILYADYIENGKRYYRGIFTILDDLFVPVIAIYVDEKINNISNKVLTWMRKMVEEELE